MSMTPSDQHQVRRAFRVNGLVSRVVYGLGHTKREDGRAWVKCTEGSWDVWFDAADLDPLTPEAAELLDDARRS